MFANRFTPFVDACSLAGALKRNLLLSLAEAEFYRIRWSAKVLDETQSAIERMLFKKGEPDPTTLAEKARAAMEDAFEEAIVSDYERFLSLVAGAPDPDDQHVIAAAVKARASVIVTDNIAHFPSDLLTTLNIEAKSTDAFLSDSIALDEGKAVFAIRRMRTRLRRPEMTADALLRRMEATGLIDTCDILRPFEGSL